MAANRTVAVLVGSLRKESFSRKVANAVADVAPATLRFTHIDIGALPHYNQDLDPDSPPAATSSTASRPAYTLPSVPSSAASEPKA